MVAAQVPIFVGQHRQQALPVQHHQQRQADAQRVERTAEQAEARHLADAGVEVVVQVDAVHRRTLDALADAVQRLEQPRRVGARERLAVGLVEVHPERTQSRPEQAQREHEQPAAGEVEAPVGHRHDHPGHNAHRQPEAGQHPEVAERGERRDATPVARAVVRTRVLAQANQVNKIRTVHPTPVKDSSDSCYRRKKPR
ncbi:hypothetical protein D3C72_934940 [compost metagenome]